MIKWKIEQHYATRDGKTVNIIEVNESYVLGQIEIMKGKPVTLTWDKLGILETGKSSHLDIVRPRPSIFAGEYKTLDGSEALVYVQGKSGKWLGEVKMQYGDKWIPTNWDSDGTSQTMNQLNLVKRKEIK